MSVLHICCNLAGSTVFPQLFEALDAQGIEQIVFVPEKRAADLNKNEPRGVKTVRAMTVKQSDALFFFRKAQRSVPAIEKQIDLSGVTLIHAHIKNGIFSVSKSSLNSVQLIRGYAKIEYDSIHAMNAQICKNLRHCTIIAADNGHFVAKWCQAFSSCFYCCCILVDTDQTACLTQALQNSTGMTASA